MTKTRLLVEWRERAMAMFDAGGKVAETVEPIGVPRTVSARVKDHLARVDRPELWANAATARGGIERLFEQAQRALLQPDVVIEPRADGGYLYRGMNRPAQRALERDIFDWYDPPQSEGDAIVVHLSSGSCYAEARDAVVAAGFTVLELP